MVVDGAILEISGCVGGLMLMSCLWLLLLMMLVWEELKSSQTGFGETSYAKMLLSSNNVLGEVDDVLRRGCVWLLFFRKSLNYPGRLAVKTQNMGKF